MFSWGGPHCGRSYLPVVRLARSRSLGQTVRCAECTARTTCAMVWFGALPDDRWAGALDRRCYAQISSISWNTHRSLVSIPDCRLRMERLFNNSFRIFRS